VLADALSRREQDVPKENDDRIIHQRQVLISPELIISPAQVNCNVLFEEEELQNLWQLGIEEDTGLIKPVEHE
jgi:hypothetical protein